MSGIFHIENTARRKLGAAPEWKAFRFEAITGGYVLTGGVPVGAYKSGPRKGSPKWALPGQQVLISDQEVQVETDRYVQETGNCPECLGKKEVFDYWSQDHGIKRKPCADCKATGKVQVPA